MQCKSKLELGPDDKKHTIKVKSRERRRINQLKNLEDDDEK